MLDNPRERRTNRCTWKAGVKESLDHSGFGSPISGIYVVVRIRRGSRKECLQVLWRSR